MPRGGKREGAGNKRNGGKNANVDEAEKAATKADKAATKAATKAKKEATKAEKATAKAEKEATAKEQTQKACDDCIAALVEQINTPSAPWLSVRRSVCSFHALLIVARQLQKKTPPLQCECCV